MSKRAQRRPDLVLIQECDWCGAAFARQMQGGMFCDQACRWEHENHKRQVDGKRQMTVTEMIETYENNPRD